jgi:hypothetical protein
VVPGDQDGTSVARRMKASYQRSGSTSCMKMMSLPARGLSGRPGALLKA